MNILIKNILCINIMIILLSGTLYLTEKWGYLQQYMLIGGIVGITFCYLLTLKKVRFNISIFLVYSLFTLTCLISALLNEDKELFVGAVLLYVMYISLGILFSTIFNNKCIINKFLGYLLLLTHIPLLFLPIILNGINSVPYKGMFYNPNSLGAVAVLVYIVAFSKISVIIEDYIFGKKINPLEACLYILFLFFTFLIILYSNSRTSFSTVVIITTVFIILLILKTVIKGRITSRIATRTIVTIITVTLLGCFVIYNTNIVFLVKSTVINKTIEKSNNLLAGRGAVWETTLNQAKLFGNGRDYFASNNMAPYSTYISLLGQYGILPAILFCIFLLLAIYYSYTYIRVANNDTFRYLPFNIILAFILMSFTEGMFFKTCMIIFYLSIGVISEKNYKKALTE